MFVLRSGMVKETTLQLLTKDFVFVLTERQKLVTKDFVFVLTEAAKTTTKNPLKKSPRSNFNS
jgi:hypothetical protein